VPEACHSTADCSPVRNTEGFIVVEKGKNDLTTDPGGPNMKLIRSAIVAGIAKKVIDEARKPENQAKIKALIAQATAKAKQSRTSGGGGTYGRTPH
jgi:hypothetical protein